MSDETEENNSREEVKAEDRWLKAGLLMLAEVWSGVESLRNIIQSGQHVVQVVEQFIQGASRVLPHAVAVRIMDASDAANDRLRQAEHLATAIPYNVSERYTDLHTLAMRALGVASDAQGAASTLADQASGMQARIERSGLTFLTVGTGESSDGQAALPALPVDADSTAMLAYNSMSGLPSTSVAALIAPISSTASGMSPTLPPLRANELSSDGQGTTGGTTSTDSASAASCPASDDDAPDPQVEYERTSVMAKGAETNTAATLADVQQTRDQVRALREREEEAERQAFWLDLLHFIKLL